MTDYLDYAPVSERVWKVVEGYVDVDAGLMMIGDPCYTLPDDASSRKELGTDWGDFCNRLWEEEEEVVRAKGLDPYVAHMVSDPAAEYGIRTLSPEEHRALQRVVEDAKPDVYHPWQKHKHAAIVTKTGYGDGTYPVEVEYVEYGFRTGMKERRVKSVTVTFIGDDEDYEEDE